MRLSLLFLTVLCFALTARSQTRLAQIFGDKMVIQRDKPIKIWGWGKPSSRVKVSFAGNQAKARVTKDGSWQVQLEALPANANPQELRISSSDTNIVLKDILIGDVWICSGQSNMNYTINRFPYAQEEADSAQFPLIRMLTVKKEFSVLEESELSAVPWKEAVGSNILPFSATAYFFGRKIHRELGVPVGLMATSWGGTNVEAWMPQHSFQQFPVIDSIFQAQKADLLSQKLEEKEKEWMRIINEEVKTGIGMKEGWFLPTQNISDWEKRTIPMDNEDPLFDNFDGAYWFKKEFEVPLPFRGKDLKLNLGKMNDYSQVWINGHEVGEFLRKSDWRNQMVKKEFLKPGKNQITVRIFDYEGKGGWITDPYFVNIHPMGDSKGYYLLSGDWKYKRGKALDGPLQLPKIPNRVTNLTKTIPGCLYNKMIHPIARLSITGAIWYQGESNSQRGYEYSQLFPAMIRGWRKSFGQGDFPFLFVQLPNFEAKERDGIFPNWAELRQAQGQALELANTAMAVTIDIGDPNNVHPKNKQDVGKRLGLAALGMHHGMKFNYKAPGFESLEVDGEKLVLTFSDVVEGLKNSNEDFMGPLLNHFEVSDQNGKFYPAKAKILEKNTIIVWSAEVKSPQNVRYAWKNNPQNINFYNSEGLPVAPFHAGKWEWQTRKNTYLKSVEAARK